MAARSIKRIANNGSTAVRCRRPRFLWNFPFHREIKVSSMRGIICVV
jgi:hypothetical protein